MKTCLIYQPIGLGDILWIQKIVDVILNDGYRVFFPVEDIYFYMVSTSISKKNLFWVRTNDDFPLKQFFGTSNVYQTKNELYLPISFSDRYFPQCSVMLSKYYFLDISLSDYRKHFEINRNYDREQKLIDTYGLTGEFVLINKSFGTNPKQREFVYNSDKLIHVMNIDEDKKNGFNLFDWIGAIEKAFEIHTVETSLCYLIDKYATTEKLYMYEKRVNDEPNTYYRNVALVYRNPNWIYGN